ncbi:MAG TPA: metallophosphoesterase [Candidatus Moranbacteria bacterium]|nr:metallophosphoesterase [Candidatus Moranbacteria bacterium]
MKKYVKIFIAFIFLVGLSFSLGMGGAEIQMRFIAPKKTVIILKSEVAKKADIPNVSLPETPPVLEEPEKETPPPEEVKEEKEKEQIEKEEEFSFAVIGDSQYFKINNPVGGLQKAVKNIDKNKPDVVLALGDMVSSCDTENECISKYNEWKRATSPFSGKIYAVQGNHDRTGEEKSDKAWERVFNFPTNGPEGYKKFAYSFNFKNAHFVALDSEKPHEHIINDVQRRWLEQDLSANRGKNIFVFFHEPAYPTGDKIGESLDAENKDRNDLWNILTRNKVKAVFSGHEHIHSRKNIGGIYQFIVGNTDSFNHVAPKSGMAEYSYVGDHYAIVNVVKGKKVNIKIFTVEGKELNSFDF